MYNFLLANHRSSCCCLTSDQLIKGNHLLSSYQYIAIWRAHIL